MTAKSAASIAAESRAAHLNRMPEDLFACLTSLCNQEDRSMRYICVLLLRAALADMQQRGCHSIAEYMDYLGVTMNTALIPFDPKTHVKM